MWRAAVREMCIRDRSASVVRMVWLSLFDLVTGRYGMSELAVPVGTVNVIADVTASAASSKNLGSLLRIMAVSYTHLDVYKRQRQGYPP